MMENERDQRQRALNGIEKKKKKRNFSDGEIKRLLTTYSDNKVMLNSKFSSSVSLRAKQDIWNLIKGEVNAEGVENRAVKEIQHKWKDLLSRIQKRLI